MSEAIAGVSAQYHTSFYQSKVVSADVSSAENRNTQSDLSSINEAQNYYDSIIKQEIDFDLSEHIELDNNQLKIDQEAHKILSAHIKDLGDLDAFNLSYSILLDQFNENPLRKPLDDKNNPLIQTMNKIGDVYEKLFQGLISQEKAQNQIEQLSKIASEYVEANKSSDENMFAYTNWKHYKYSDYALIAKEKAKNEFINLYQIDKDFTKTEAFMTAFEQYLTEKDRLENIFYKEGKHRIDTLYNGDISELVKSYVAGEGKSRGEWLELFENNAQVMRDHVYRDDFANRPQHLQVSLIDRLNLAESILSDAYEMWGKGSELNVVA
jgi:hypothetical protein